MKDALEQIYGEREAKAMLRFALEHITGHDRSWLFTHDYTLTDDEQQQYDDALRRMLTGEPVQYIFNSVDFMGLQLYVDRRVLIPRPETEELVQWVLDDHVSLRGCRQCVVSDGSKQLTAIDACTGSGCIALALKYANPAWDIHAFDISGDALEVAQFNSKALDLPITLRCNDIKTWGNGGDLRKYDIIVCNPPYIMPSEKSLMADNVLKYEPGSALFVEPDDFLWPYRALAKAAKRYLTDNGTVYAEINPLLADETKAVFANGGFNVTLRNDMQGKQRMLRAKIICNNYPK